MRITGCCKNRSAANARSPSTDLINRRFGHSTYSKDYEFFRAPVRQLWEAGLDDVRRGP